MEGRKRKAAPIENGRPNKKHQVAEIVEVKHIRHESNKALPIIASAPGIAFPAAARFQAYTKRISPNRAQLHLHSAEHDKIQHTAVEGTGPSENQLKHYVAVFDPSSQKLHLAEAKRLQIRATIRTTQLVPEDEDEDVAQSQNRSTQSTKAALTAAFGTKKSKKAAQSAAENRLLAHGDEDADNPISASMINGVSDDETVGLSPEAVDPLRANKPVPPASLQTNKIEQVYPLSVLVQPKSWRHTLQMMQVGNWISRFDRKKPIQTRSRFVSFRVDALLKHLQRAPEDDALLQNIQLLRYINLLVELHSHVRTIHRRTPVPPVEKWPEIAFSEGTPLALVDRINHHFFPGDRLPTVHALTLLRTTILALTLHVPPPSLRTRPNTLVQEITDISLDLAIDKAEVRKLYRELGCRVESANDGELDLWGLERQMRKRKGDDNGDMKTEKPSFAKLRFPIEFPKLSRGAPVGRR